MTSSINENTESVEKTETPVKKIEKLHKLAPKKILIGGSAVIVMVLLIYGYSTYNKIYPSTDNAYVQADIINISTKVGGYVKKVFVENNQYVHKGDILVEIDPIDYNLKESEAQSNEIKSQGQLDVAKERVSIAKSNLIKAKSSLRTANSMSTRYSLLYKQDAGSLQDAQKYINQEIQAEKNVDQATSSLKEAMIQINIANSNINLAKVSVDVAKLNIHYTHLLAPSDGYVSNLKIYQGQLVVAGQALFGFVDNKVWWINANFKETDINRIKAGQKVTVDLDMYDHTYNAVVNSVSNASGAAFSLLPPENASGNWVKVTQRFPVKITIKDDPKYPLRYGASASVSINTL